jgi:formylmethanofuran dehydrogenase subunit E
MHLPIGPDFLNRTCHALGGGQRQRVVISQARVTDPLPMAAAMLDWSSQAILFWEKERSKMSAEAILTSDLFKKCLDFHGHLCPGLALGYQAAQAGMHWLTAQRAEDEEVVAIVETDACCADAVQVITGCTFGKGNFIYRDYGKIAFTFFYRATGKGVRIARTAEKEIPVSPEQRKLQDKIRQQTATEAELEQADRMRAEASKRILDKQPEELFTITEVTVPLPEKARIEPSVNCDRCKEPVMGSKLVQVGGEWVCRGCLA